MSSPYRKMNVCYSPKLQENEKDLIISQLKAQVFELEQNEKNFNSLNLKVRALQSEINVVSEEKLRLEYELKQRVETTDKQILDLRQTVENLQLELSDKIQVNKKLFSDNNNFYRLVEARNAEINDIKDDRNRIIDENSELRERLSQYESAQIHDKNNISSLRNQIDILSRDLDKSNENLAELNDVLKNTQNEKTSLAVKLEESKREVSNLNAHIKRKEDSLSFASKNIDELNETLQAYKNKNFDLEKKLSQISSEMNLVNSSLSNEKNARVLAEKTNSQLEVLLSEKDKENRRLFSDNTELKNQGDRCNIENKLLVNEIEKFKNHIFILTEQNQEVSINICNNFK
jgi:chromosome segregation ATPase